MKKLKIQFWKVEKSLVMRVLEQEGLPDYIVKDINSVLKNDIIPMYESMVEDMKGMVALEK